MPPRVLLPCPPSLPHILMRLPSVWPSRWMVTLTPKPLTLNTNILIRLPTVWSSRWMVNAPAFATLVSGV